MDHFGIGAAMRAMLVNYSQSARRTGRTTSLLDDVEPGDRVVFANSKHAREFQQLLRERFRSMRVDPKNAEQISCVVVDPKEPHKVFELGTPKGRTIFDHTWIEMFYALEVDRAIAFIDKLQRETSGYGAAHRETARKAAELRRWDYISNEGLLKMMGMK